MLDYGLRRTEPAVGCDGQGGHAAAAVVGHKDAAAGLVNDEMTRARPAGTLFIEKRQRPRARVNGIGLHTLARRSDRITALIDRIEMRALGIHGNE